MKRSSFIVKRSSFELIAIAVCSTLFLLANQAQAAGPYFDPELSFQGLLRSSPTTYVADGAYCGQVTLNRNGAGTWQKKFSNFTITNGVFNVVASGNDDSAVPLTSSLFELLTSNADTLTVDVKVDYSSAICAPVPTYTDTYTGIPIYSVPTAMVADRANSLVGTVAGSQITGTVALSLLDTTGASNGDVMTYNGASWTHGPPASGSSLSNGAGAVTVQTAGTGNVTIGNSSDTTAINSSTVDVASAAVASTVVIGNTTGTTGVTISSGSGGVTINGAFSAPLASGKIWVGNAGGTSAPVSLSGDASLANTGALTLGAIQGYTVDLSTAPTNGQVLSYSTGTSKWTAQSPAATGITSLDGSGAGAQTLVVGTAGTDFNIGDVGGTHTFNLPNASAANRGALTSADWTTFNTKVSRSGDTMTGALAIATGTDTKQLTIKANGSQTQDLQEWQNSGGVAQTWIDAAGLIHGDGSNLSNLPVGSLTGTLGVTSGGTGLSSTTANQILYSSGANTIAGLATANNGTLVTSNTGVPSISSTLPTAVQGNITSTGTITSGIWNGTAIAVGYGGTGLASGTSGGVPYFNAANTMASSGALGANGLVIGGGAGAAPSTIGTGTLNNILMSNGAGAPSWTASPSLTTVTAIGTTTNAALTGTGAQTTGNTIDFTDTALTSGNIVSLKQNTSAMTGDAIFANLANGSGTFTGNLVDLQVNSSSKFKVDSSGNISVGGTQICTSTGCTANSTAASTLTGVVPIANGGTNSSTVLNNNRLIISSGGAIVEAGAMTDGQVVVGKSGSAPQIVSLSGDASVTNAGAWTNAKVNGVSYPSGPGTNTIPEVTSANTVGYTATPTLTSLTVTGAAASAALTGTGAQTTGNTIDFTDTAITSGNIVSLKQNTSAMTGDAIFANLANGSGTFTGNLVDLQVNSSSKFKVDSSGNISVGGTQICTSTGCTANSTAASTLTGVVPVANGGTNSSTVLNNNRLIISSGGAVVEAGAMTDGQVVVGKSGSAPQIVSLTGDASVTNAGAWTNAKVNGVSYPSGPATGTIPQVTAANTVAYSATPVLGVNATTTGTIGLANGAGSGLTTTIQPSASTTTAWTMTLPSSGGTNNFVLTTNGSGVTSWTQASTLTGSVNSGTAGQLTFYSGTGSAVSGDANANISNGALTLGQANSVLGDLILEGSSSGAVTVQPQAAAGTYNFNLPTGAGTSGQALLSGGGGATAMTFGTLGVAAGGTGQSSALTANGVVYASSTTAMASTGTGTSGQVLTSNGAGVPPTFQNTGGAIAPIYTAGNFYQMPILTNAAAGIAATAGSIYFYPIYIQTAITIESLSIQVTTGAAGGAAFWNLGLYSTVGGKPSALLASGAGSNASTTGLQTMALSSNYSITAPGWYWIAFQASDTTMRNISVGSNGNGAASILGQSLGYATANLTLANSSTGYSMAGSVQTVAGIGNITLPATTSGLVNTNGSTMPLVSYQVFSIP